MSFWPVVHRQFFCRITYVIALGCCPISVCAQEQAPGLPSEAIKPPVAIPLVIAPQGSTLINSVRLALESHPNVRVAQAKLEAARFGLSAAEWGRYPSLAAEMSRSQDGDAIRRLQLQQPLWAGGRIDADIGSNSTKVTAATAAIREAELGLAEQIVQTAVELRKARVQLARANESLSGYQKLLDAIERRAEGGLGLQSDVILARSRIAQAKASSAQFEANERRINTRWMALTGISSTDLKVPETTAADAASVEELLSDAKAFSPALARLQAEVETAGFDAEATQASAWPQLSVRAVRSWQSGVVNLIDTQYLAVLEYQPGSGLGVIDRARATYAQRDATQAQIAKTERDIEEQIRSAIADRQGFSARVTALDAASTANAEIIDSFIRQYNIGKRTWLDVLNAQREWTESVQLAEETRYNALASAYRLAVLSGRFFK